MRVRILRRDCARNRRRYTPADRFIFGSPAQESRTVLADGSVSDGGGVNPVTGYTIVDALDFDEAIALTAGCPIFDADGSIEILEME